MINALEYVWPAKPDLLYISNYMINPRPDSFSWRFVANRQITLCRPRLRLLHFGAAHRSLCRAYCTYDGAAVCGPAAGGRCNLQDAVAERWDGDPVPDLKIKGDPALAAPNFQDCLPTTSYVGSDSTVHAPDSNQPALDPWIPWFFSCLASFPRRLSRHVEFSGQRLIMTLTSSHRQHPGLFVKGTMGSLPATSRQ